MKPFGVLLGGAGAEQPLPRAMAGSSTAYVGSAKNEAMTQFWLARRRPLRCSE
jgi:hypothetical protein